MKIKNLKNYRIPSYVLDIWEEHYSFCLLPRRYHCLTKSGIDFGHKQSYHSVKTQGKEL